MPRFLPLTYLRPLRYSARMNMFLSIVTTTVAVLLVLRRVVVCLVRPVAVGSTLEA